MSKKKTIRVEDPENIEHLIKALNTDRKRLAQICEGIGSNSIGWWKHAGNIPTVHLKRLGEVLAMKLFGKKKLEPTETKAKEFVVTALSIYSLDDLLTDVRFPKSHLNEYLKVMNSSESDLKRTLKISSETLGNWKHSHRINIHHFTSLKDNFFNLPKDVQAAASTLYDTFNNPFSEDLALLSLEEKSALDEDESSIRSDNSKSEISPKQLLSKIDDKQLVRELERRGWKVSLSLGGK
jgi:hypothetical protein